MKKAKSTAKFVRNFALFIGAVGILRYIGGDVPPDQSIRRIENALAGNGPKMNWGASFADAMWYVSDYSWVIGVILIGAVVIGLGVRLKDSRSGRR